jgi:pimeloyl-ACP methyl ester carboxylesterase
MAQANTPVGQRLKLTAAGNPYDLNELDLPQADGLINLAGALSEGALGLANLDPSVTDEDEPLSCDPSLDMFNPANGYRRPPEVSKYSGEFLSRYRAAQVARCQRIDARAFAEIERKRIFRAQIADPSFADLPLDQQNQIIRQSVASQTLVIYRTMADPALTDLTIHPNQRGIIGLMQPDPQAANWSIPGFVQMMTAEGWLSTWSGLSTQVDMHKDACKVTQPVLSITLDADVTILPFVGKGLYENAASADKTYVEIAGDHFAFRETEPRDGGIPDVAAAIVDWLRPRFAAAGGNQG